MRVNAGGLVAHAEGAGQNVQSVAPAAPADAEDALSPRARIWRHPLFVGGAVAKLGLAALCGSHFATRWFAPFVYAFVRDPFHDPWSRFLARGEPLAFPYGAGMLALLGIPVAPFAALGVQPASHLGLLALRLAPFAADVAICMVLAEWLRGNAKDALVFYWLNPVVIYATYIHGQLDLIPTGLLCVSVAALFRRRVGWAAVVFGVALATKLHHLIALPALAIYVLRLRRLGPLRHWFAVVALLVASALYAPCLRSEAFLSMVFGSPESGRLFGLSVSYGKGLVAYIAPMAIAALYASFAEYRKMNREILIMILGLLNVALVALVPPQPGWFLWSIPFLAYLASFTSSGRVAIGLLSAAYLPFFFVNDPTTFLESLDPTLGHGFGLHAAALIGRRLPFVFSATARDLCFSALVFSGALAAAQIYRRGIATNSIYAFRDQSFMIGIGGDSGVGKHVLASDVHALLGDSLTILYGDDDHKWERGHAMWAQITHLDPRANHLGRQLSGLRALRSGGDAQRRHYDHVRGRFTEQRRVLPNDFMAIIGLHPFYLPSQRRLLHLMVYLDPDPDVRLAWKTARDMRERGYTKEQVMSGLKMRQGDSARFVRPQRRYADVIVSHQAGVLRSEPREVALCLKVRNELDPLSLVEALSRVRSLKVDWEPDERLIRDTLRVSGTAEGRHVAAIAEVLLEGGMELLTAGAWLPGGRGVAQLAILHAINVRMRLGAATA